MIYDLTEFPSRAHGSHYWAFERSHRIICWEGRCLAIMAIDGKPPDDSVNRPGDLGWAIRLGVW